MFDALQAFRYHRFKGVGQKDHMHIRPLVEASDEFLWSGFLDRIELSNIPSNPAVAAHLLELIIMYQGFEASSLPAAAALSIMNRRIAALTAVGNASRTLFSVKTSGCRSSVVCPMVSSASDGTISGSNLNGRRAREPIPIARSLSKLNKTWPLATPAVL